MAEKRPRFIRKVPLNRLEQAHSLTGLSDGDDCWCPRISVVFNVLLSARITAAFLSNISDCDETFNYWEPMHYLLYKSGFQTWEYSPEFGLRSYAYLLLHALPATIVKEFFHANKITVFYYVRFILGIVAAACETYFFKSIQYQFGNYVARSYFFVSAVSTGMFISSAAFLPSSFVMYCGFIAYGGWFLSNYVVAVFGIALGTLLGWPFFALLGLPIASDMILRQKKLVKFIYLSGGFFLAIMIPTVAIDSHYYGKQVIAPLNIVLYNVFGGAGPDLYGVESFWFYFVNGFLNFNIVFFLALISLPVCIGVGMVCEPPSRSFQKLPLYFCLSPVYLWIAVFFTRPHKEERFLFPIYPFILLNASLVIECIKNIYSKLLEALEYSRERKRSVGEWISITIIITTTVISLSRTSALYIGYHAPLEIYPELDSLVHPLDGESTPMFRENEKLNVCVGREWYRFTSSFFLPENWRLAFVKSDFSGQLPQMFANGEDGTRRIPKHMNDMNREEITAYTDISLCDLMVDIDLPTNSIHEQNYVQNSKQWKVIATKNFLLSSKSHPFLRAFYIPFVSPTYTSYVHYNLLLKRSRKARRRKI